MRPNKLRELLKANKPTLGTHVHISWPSITELVGLTEQYDYIEFVAEYAPYDLYALENIGRAISLYPNMSGMIKIEQEPRTYLTIRAIGSGIQNILFADVRTRADAEACVRAVRAESPVSRYPGIHGVGMRRDVSFVLEGGTPAFIEALDDAVVALMIEKKEAVENLESILSVPGIDMVQFGPSDYSMSIGQPSQYGHAQVREAEKHVVETAHKMGIPARAEPGSPDQIERYLEMGVRHFCMGTDVAVLFQWWKQNGARAREIIASL